MKKCLRAATALLFSVCALPAAAQVTHDVDNGPGFEFVPASLTVALGDTVRWTWIGGFHNVTSGVGGVSDGNFTSGSPTSTIGTTFEVTFDAAFLAANPMPGDSYPYFCAVHEAFGQTGVINVVQNLPYGDCNSTPGSLVLLSGEPDVGTTFTLGIDDPPGSSAVGSISALLISIAPAAGFPCGIPLPGFGMSGAVGDLLVSLPADVGLVGPAWAGPGSPAPIAVPVPANAALAGLHIYAQGALTGVSGSRLTEGQRLVIALP